MFIKQLWSSQGITHTQVRSCCTPVSWKVTADWLQPNAEGFLPEAESVTHDWQQQIILVLSPGSSVLTHLRSPRRERVISAVLVVTCPSATIYLPFFFFIVSINDPFGFKRHSCPVCNSFQTHRHLWIWRRTGHLCLFFRCAFVPCFKKTFLTARPEGVNGADII